MNYSNRFVYFSCFSWSCYTALTFVSRIFFIMTWNFTLCSLSYTLSFIAMFFVLSELFEVILWNTTGFPCTPQLTVVFPFNVTEWNLNSKNKGNQWVSKFRLLVLTVLFAAIKRLTRLDHYSDLLEPMWYIHFGLALLATGGHRSSREISDRKNQHS